MLRYEREQVSLLDQILIPTHASTVCTRGRCTNYRVAVTLSPCRTVQVGISAHKPQHILCLKTDTMLTSSLCLAQLLWPTFNGKSQRFVVGYWKLSLWLRYVIINNSCSKSFLSHAFLYTLSLSLFRYSWKEGSVTWFMGIFLDTEGRKSVRSHVCKTNTLTLNAGCTSQQLSNFSSQFSYRSYFCICFHADVDKEFASLQRSYPVLMNTHF